MTQPTPSPALHHGSCHCGAVRFEVTLDALRGSQCNCSICTKLGAFNTIVKPAAFRLVAGEDALSSYTFRTEMARRYFCSRCGVAMFGRGHLEVLGGDFVSVSLRALDDIDLLDAECVYWDGRHDNWQAGPRPTPWRQGAATA